MRTSLQLSLLLVLATSVAYSADQDTIILRGNNGVIINNVVRDNANKNGTDLSQVLFDFRGDPIVDETRPGPRDPVTGKLSPPRFCFADEFVANPKNCDALKLGVAIAAALVRGSDPENPDPSFDELKRRDLLASKAANMNNVELTPEEKVLIRRIVKKYWTPVVSARVLQVLEK